MRTLLLPTLDTSEVIKILPSGFPIGSLEMMDGRTQDLTGCFGAHRRQDFGRASCQSMRLAPPIFPTLGAKRHRLLLLSTRLKAKMSEVLNTIIKTEKYISDGERIQATFL